MGLSEKRNLENKLKNATHFFDEKVSDESSGIGLGLIISQSFALKFDLNLKGLTFKSRKNKGSTFKFRINPINIEKFEPIFEQNFNKKERKIGNKIILKEKTHKNDIKVIFIKKENSIISQKKKFNEKCFYSNS